jgi:hypothetical protein
MRDLYISRIGLPMQENTVCGTIPWNIYIAHRRMNMKIGFGTEAAQFPEKKYINGIFLAVHGNFGQ